MKISTVTKQPGEKRRWAIDYTDALDTFDEVESVAIACEPEGLTLSAFAAHPKVRVVCSGGISGVTYKATITMTTTDGNEVFEDELMIKIKEL